MLRLITKGTFPVFFMPISDIPGFPKATSISDTSDNSRVAISLTINLVPLLNKIFSSEVVFMVTVLISPF